MYRHFVCVLLLLFAVVIGIGSASAQVLISLGATSGANIVTFTNVIGPPHQLNLTLGPCSGGGGTMCTLTSGPGANSSLIVDGSISPPSSFYTFTTMLAAVGQLPFLNNPTNGVFQYNANGSATTFSISGIGSPGGNLLLNIFISNVAGSTITPTFNGAYSVSSVTAGSQLAQFFLVGNVGDLSFTLVTGSSPLSIFNSGTDGAQTSGNIDHGAVHLPEPTSIALFGSGLLLLGRVLRRRKTLTPADPSEG